MKRTHLLLLTLLSSFPSLGSVIIPGGESKTRGGLGNLSTRGSGALYSSPSQLTQDKEPLWYIDINWGRAEYSFEVDGKTNNYSFGFPWPIVGYSDESSWGHWAVSGLIIPPGASSLELKGLNSRETGENLVPLNIRQDSGDKFGFVLVLGHGLEWRNWRWGWSLHLRRSSLSEEIIDVETGVLLREENLSKYSGRLLLSISKNWNSTTLVGIDFSPWHLARETGNSKTIGLIEYQEKKIDDQLTRPISATLSLKKNWPALTLEANLKATYLGNNQKERDLELDTNDTLDFALSSSVPFNDGLLILGFGNYQSFLGEGIMNTRASNNKEVRGFSFGDVDAIPHQIYSFGYETRVKEIDYLVYLSFLSIFKYYKLATDPPDFTLLMKFW